MAFFDWDGNEKKDFADDFIEYNIFIKTCIESDNSGNKNLFDLDNGNEECDELLDKLDEN